MNKQLTARQLASKAIHEDKENVRNPSIMAKYMNEHTNSKLNKIVEMTEELKSSEFSEYEINWNNALDEAILIIKSELIKTS